MSYPLPGMNPWLENPLLWRDVHHRLISTLADELAPRLRPRYFVAVETRTLFGSAVVVAPLKEAVGYITVELPLENIKEGYLEVRLVPSGEVVTVIEVLSPTNKQPGRDRENYITKREELLKTDVGFVEIDFLRAGLPMPHTEAATSDYRLFIRRRQQPYHARLYPLGLRQPIPLFQLPLLPDDTEPIVDLGALLKSVYDRAGYDLVIDYNQPPLPPLSVEDAVWAKELLASSPS